MMNGLSSAENDRLQSRPGVSIADRLRGIAKEHGLLLGMQIICLLVIGRMFGGGPGIVVGFMLGAVIFGFWKENREPGSLRGYFGNWKRALAATATLVCILLFVGGPLLAIAILLTPTAAQDWNDALAEYNKSPKAMIFAIVVVGTLALGFIAGAHLLFTRLGFKIVAVTKGSGRDKP